MQIVVLYGVDFVRGLEMLNVAMLLTGHMNVGLLANHSAHVVLYSG